MKPLGKKKTRTRFSGHQDCDICHPDTKAGRAAEKRMARLLATPSLDKGTPDDAIRLAHRLIAETREARERRRNGG